MSKRAHLSLKTKLAAALLALEDYQIDPATGKTHRMPLIPYEDAKRMSADFICSLWHFDHHPIRKADGGTDHPSNLTPRLIAEHRAKTAKVDVPEMAKSKRIRRKEMTHKLQMSALALDRDGGVRLRSRIPSHPFPKIKRSMRRK